MTGWTSSTWSGSGTASRDTTVHRTGNASANVTIPGAGTVGHSTSVKIPVDRGTYTYGAWIRTDGVGTESAYLDILFHDANVGTRSAPDHSPPDTARSPCTARSHRFSPARRSARTAAVSSAVHAPSPASAASASPPKIFS